MTQHEVVPPRREPQRRAVRIVFLALFGLAVAVFVTSIVIPVVTIQPYLEQSTSMQPTLAPGDRMLAIAGSSGIRRGDIVVLRVPARISGTDDLFVKRVIGLPGDLVACCNAKGRVTVNGKPLNESYVYPGNPPSRARFSARLRRGQIWVMGDHRNISVDSRTWGPVPASGVVGQVIFAGHGASLRSLRTPQTFVSDGLAPADTRADYYAWLAFAAVASLAVLLVLAITGAIRLAIRRRRPPPAAAAPRPLVEPLYGVYRAPQDPAPPGGPADA